MRIQRLDLRAFGPFSNVAIDLDAGQQGLHLIFGPNEAGKSSSLRALRQMLFGIPSQSRDNFIHPNANLRIGAELRRSDGSTLSFLRRKGNKNTLLAADNSTPITDEALRQFLGGLEAGTFETLFGLDHPRLVAGGQELAAGGGELGQILFAAGSGIAGLRAVEQLLAAEADKLFKPRGANPEINRLCTDLRAAQDVVRSLELPSGDWSQKEQTLRDAQARLAQIATQLQAAGRERSRLDRLREALPLFARRREWLARQSTVGPLPVLGERFAEERSETVTLLRSAQAAHLAAEQAVRDLDEQLSALPAADELVAEADALKPLADELGSHRKALRDLPGLKAKLELVEGDARGMLAELRPDLTLDDTAPLRLTKNQQVAVQNLGNRHEALIQQRSQAEADIQRWEDELATAQHHLAALPPARDTTVLAGALDRARPAAGLEGDRNSLRLAVDQADKQILLDLRRLAPFQGTLAELEQLAIPAAETIDRFADDFATNSRQRAEVEKAAVVAAAERDDFTRRMADLQREGQVPCEEDLRIARDTRDAAWRGLRQAWQAAQTPEAEQLSSFELQSTQADDLADRLRRDANRVRDRVHLEAGERAAADRYAALLESRHRHEVDHAKLEADWQATWQPAGLAPHSPREMRAWREAQQTLLRTAAAHRQERARLEMLDERVASLRGELSRALDKLGSAPLAGYEPLAGLVTRGDAVLASIREIETRRDQLSESARHAGTRLASARAVHTQSSGQLEDWQRQWREALAPLGLNDQATPSQANACLEQIRDLFEKLSHAKDVRSRITEIADDTASFSEHVHRHAARLAPDLLDRPVAEAADELLRRANAARVAHEKREGLSARRAERLAEGQSAARQLAELQTRLTALCQEAGCDHPEALPGIEERVAQGRELARQLATVESRLLELGRGLGLNDFQEETTGIDPDELPSLVSEQAARLETLEREKADLHRVIGGLESELKRMDGRSEAALAAEAAEGLSAELENSAREYVRLRLAAEVLRGGIERYREKNQGPVLDRASRYFARLTLGSFAGLRPDTDDAGRPVLVGVRPSGETVGVAGMSEGTCDQLYLALRLAGLEAWLDTHESIPLVLDDILINFDNERALAALECLAECAARTQVIFFTHHEHLVELAQARLDPDVVFVHELPGRAGIGRTTANRLRLAPETASSGPRPR